MTPSRRAGWAGLFVAAAVVAGGGFLATRAFQEYWLDRPWRIHLATAHGYGLAAGNPVKLNGVTIGWIDAVRLDSTGTVLAELSVKRRYRHFLTDRARFSIRPPFLIGDAWVDISAGPAGGRPLERRETVFVEVEAPAGQLEALGITPERVSETLDVVQRLLTDAAVVMRDIREGRGNLGRLVGDTVLYEAVERALLQANDVLSRSLRGDTTVGRFLSEDALYTEVTGLTKEIRETLTSLRGEEEEAKAAVRNLNALLADARGAVRELSTVAANVNAGKGTVGKLAHDEAIFVETQRILAQLRQALEDLREQTPISTFLGALFSAF